MAAISGGELIAKMLKEEGVDTVFGIIDGTYFGLYSNFKANGIRLITPRHESCAVHMAGSYARLTGKLGVCIASNGPGVANSLPGVAVENAEGNRVLLITSCRRHGIVYPDRGGSYQYFDQTAVMQPMTKWTAAVPSFDRIQELMQRALRQSYIGRPGVVHIDVPEDIMNSKVKGANPALRKPSEYRRVDPITPTADQIAKAAGMLASAKLPMIHAGSGVLHAQAWDELQELSELLKAPVTTSWGGRGAIPETCETSVPMSYVDVNSAVRTRADLVLAIGTRIGETDWWGKAPYWKSPGEQPVIRVDVDDEMLGLNRPSALGILADAKAFLKALIAELKQRSNLGTLPAREAWLTEISVAKADARKKFDEFLDVDTDPMHSAHVSTICDKVFADDDILIIDGGNTAIWAHFFHTVRKSGTINTTYKFGMLGAGAPHSLGAQAGFPDRQVYCITADGAMGFHPQELETAIRNDLKVIFIVLCDGQWGMVKINQQFMLKPIKTLIKKTLSPEETINADLGEIRFDQLAQSMGAHGERVSKADQLEPALKRAKEAGKCAVIHVDVDPVAHMWAPGLKNFKDMHGEPKG